ncbi:hypothetical protein BOW52_08590 [Solemya elarraichensis gill symbiont]|uniref:Fe2OG dioxygenase domain-containing protein n=2 Tax=Solemya elarraichensis gill symbiont TaxID=1918949 RepID=A0A1T2KZY2_9GAMM|nr:hypothetical protein BOW52_08590 [Solemya elarraichensis gill symbiont]
MLCLNNQESKKLTLMTMTDLDKDSEWHRLIRGSGNGLDTFLSCLIPLRSLQVTRTTIREQAAQSNTPNGFAIEKMIHLLNSWGAEPQPLPVSPATLYKQRFPLAISVSHQGKNRLLILTSINKNKAELINSNMTTRSVPLGVLQDFYAGTVFSFHVNDHTGKHDYTEKRRQEESYINAYKGSIREIRNFLSDNECEALIRLTEGRYQRSTIISYGPEKHKTLSDVRTSQSVLLKEKHALLDTIRQRAAANSHSSIQDIENLQCARYETGEEFGLHLDAFASRRKKTILVYLNDNFEGGETWFSEVDVTVEPEKGKALIFDNLNEMHLPHPLSMHAGLPITSGVKYVCNIWIHEHDPNQKRSAS